MSMSPHIWSLTDSPDPSLQPVVRMKDRSQESVKNEISLFKDPNRCPDGSGVNNITCYVETSLATISV